MNKLVSGIIALFVIVGFTTCASGGKQVNAASAPATKGAFELSADGTITEFRRWIYEDEHGLYFESCVIPAVINGKPVKAIGTGVFAGIGQGVPKVVIPESVTSIAANAFSNVGYFLDQVTMPANVEIVSDSFNLRTEKGELSLFDAYQKTGRAADTYSYKKGEGWSSPQLLVAEKAEKKAQDAANAKGVTAADFDYDLNKAGNGIVITRYNGKATIVNIPAEIEGFPVTAIIGAFKGNKNITSVTISDTVNTFSGGNYKGEGFFDGGGVFWNCSKLERVSLPRGITFIPSAMFYGCSSLTEFTIPDSVKSINKGAFMGSGLKSVAIPNSVTKIEDFAFSQCSLENLTLPDSVTDIGDGSFSKCTRLKNVFYPKKLRSLGEGAFEGCTGLTSITLQSTLIGQKAFTGCTSLVKVTINGDVENIGSAAFYGCTALSEFAINGDIGTLGGYYNTSVLEEDIKVASDGSVTRTHCCPVES